MTTQADVELVDLENAWREKHLRAPFSETGGAVEKRNLSYHNLPFFAEFI